MELDVFTKLISDMGVPIAVMAALFALIVKIISSYKKNVDEQLKEYREKEDEERKEIKTLVDKYHEDTLKINDALNNNTRAFDTLSKLVETFMRHNDNDGK